MWTRWMLVTTGVLLAGQGMGPKGVAVRDPNQPLLLGRQVLAKPLKQAKPGAPPHATVEVVGVGEQEAEQIKALSRWMTPALSAAALKGYQERESVQMLGEFMLQDPSRPKPSRIGSFHYNAYAPRR